MSSDRLNAAADRLENGDVWEMCGDPAECHLHGEMPDTARDFVVSMLRAVAFECGPTMEWPDGREPRSYRTAMVLADWILESQS